MRRAPLLATGLSSRAVRPQGYGMGFLHTLFSADFMPHGHCYFWIPGLVWLQVLSNLLVGVAYVCISATLIALARRARDVPFHRVYVAFGLFIVFCGLTHFMDVVVVWRPVYWLDGALRAFTAAISVATAVWLLVLFPEVSQMARVVAAERQRSRAQLERALVRENEARVQAEAARAERDRQTQLLQAVLAQMPSGLLVVDSDGVFAVANAKAGEILQLELTGMQRDAAREAFGLYHPDGRRFTSAEYPTADAMAGRESHTDARFRRRDGQTVVLDIWAAPIRDSDGRVTAAVVVFSDVTERRALERQFEFLAEIIPHAIWTADRRGVLDYVNPRAGSLFGAIAPNATVDDALRRAVRSDQARPVLDSWRAALASPRPYEARAQLRAADGAARTHLLRAVPFEDESKQVVRWFGTATDIEDTVAADEFMRTLFDAMPQLGWTATADGSIDYYNARWYEYTGKTFEQMKGWGWVDVHDPGMVDGVVAKWSRALATGERFEMTFRLRRADGVLRWFVTRAVPIRDRDGQIVRWVGINTDIDDQMRAEAEAAAANRSKDEFLAMLGHELRNPLAPITTALHLMKLRGAPAERERTIIERQVDHLRRLVDDLLDISRVRGGKIRLERRPVALNEVVAKGIELAEPLIEQREQQLEVALPDDATVDGDPARLAQVFANLLTNAAKYSDPGSRISIRGSVDAQSVVCSVEDNGHGIGADLLARIFEPFTQAPQAMDRGQGGLGLGLAIVRSIVELHGGTVSAHSPGPGKGATFVVRLPRLAAATVATARQPERTVPRAAAKHGRRVLVVDDNEDAAQMLATLLESEGHEVVCVGDGPGALAAVDKWVPEVALLDIGLPGMDGYELARRLRAMPALARTTLIAITGYGQKSDIEASRRAGFDDHLVKPVTPARVLAVVAASR